ASRSLLADMAAVATAAGSHLNAVMLGALASTNVLPFPAEALAMAIRGEGKAVAGNMRGFEVGLSLPRQSAPTGGVAPAALGPEAGNGLVPHERMAMMEAAAGGVLREAVARLLDFQGAGYARLYLDRLERFVTRFSAADFQELARH